MKGTMDTDDFISLAHLEATSMNMRFAYGKVNDAVEIEVALQWLDHLIEDGYGNLFNAAVAFVIGDSNSYLIGSQCFKRVFEKWA